MAFTLHVNLNVFQAILFKLILTKLPSFNQGGLRVEWLMSVRNQKIKT